MRRDRTLATVLVCCFAIPAVLAGLLGLRAPVLLDRTLTVAAWGPLLALGYLVDALVPAGPRRAAWSRPQRAALVMLAVGAGRPDRRPGQRPRSNELDGSRDPAT